MFVIESKEEKTMRMDQFAGLTKDASKFLTDNEVESTICNHCKRPFPRKLELIGTYIGMFMSEYPLHRHVLKDGKTADEFLQCAPWSSGPIHFLGLRVSDGTEFLWPVGEIDEWM